MRDHWTIFVSDDRWRLGCAREDGTTFSEIELHEGFQAAAFAARGLLSGQGYRGEGVLLAIDSLWCLVAEMPLEQGNGVKQRWSLSFELEQYLPLSAEECVADFVEMSGHVFGVAAARQQLELVIESLDEVGICIQAVAPAALLASQHVFEMRLAEAPILLLWQNGERTDIVKARPAGPWYWSSAADQSMLSQQLKYLMLRNQDPIESIGFGLGNDVIELAGPLLGIQIERDERRLEDVVALAAGIVLSGKRSLWIDFGGDLLGGARFYRPLSKLLHATCAAAAVFMLVLAGVLHLRASGYAESTARHERAQAETFSKSLPGQTIPLGIRSRLESEHARLAALRGDGQELPTRASGLAVLHDVIAALPSQLRMRILEIRIDGSEVYLEGEVRSLSDGDVIAGELRRLGFLVEPPQLARLADQGMSFRLTAQWAPDQDAVEESHHDDRAEAT